MKSAKKTIAIVLALIMLVCALPISASASVIEIGDAAGYPDGFSFTEQMKDTEWRMIIPDKGTNAEMAYILKFDNDLGKIIVNGTLNSKDYMFNQHVGAYDYSESKATIKAYSSVNYDTKKVNKDQVELKVIVFENDSYKFTLCDNGFFFYENNLPCDMYLVKIIEKSSGKERAGFLIPEKTVNYKSTALKTAMGTSNWRIDPLYIQGADYFSFDKSKENAWLVSNRSFSDRYKVVALSDTVNMLMTIDNNGLDFVVYEQIAPGAMLSIPIFKTGTSSLQFMYKAFPDVKPSETNWFLVPVTYMAVAGIISGYSNGNFGPADNLKRQDFVVLLSKMEGINESDYADKDCGLSDVEPGQYYTTAINWAVDNGIISGYQNGKFGVGDPITREQVCTILYRGMGNPTVSADDIIALANYKDSHKISDYATEPIAWAIKYHVISGMADGRLAPEATASRAQIAVILYNFIINNHEMY